MKKILTIILFILFAINTFCQTDSDRLKIILKNLEQIQSATYYQKSSSSAPGDTLMFNTYTRYFEMYANSLDTLMGASFIMTGEEDHSKVEMAYDGIYSVNLNWDAKSAKIDTIAKNLQNLPMASFFILVKSLITYSINHHENVNLKWHNYMDSTQIDFTFKNRVIEFIRLNPIVIPNNETDSKYSLVIDNKTNQPYTLYRKMPHQSSITSCTNIEFNNKTITNFKATDQIPKDFTIRSRKQYQKPKCSELEGTLAKEWKLKDINGGSVSLESLKSKVVVIQFSGIGCGPCHASMPFVNKTVNDYRNKSFEWITIENWSNNEEGIKRYKQKNDIVHKYLVADQTIRDNYKIEAVPAFFIINKDRIITKVIFGYGNEESTGKEILDAINEILN